MAPVKVHVKKGDLVMVITGKDAGKKGKVLSVDRTKGRVIVEGVNIVKRHTRPTPKMPQGGIIEKEAPVASSNVMLFCSKCNRPTRIGKQFLADGTKTRVCKKCGEVID
ncbi:MAG: 50S ribosomal protein L24 [Moorella humiferrea]|uniref:Large ribosomal subunit protein uL24 n=1 Tax=Neomoorella humiferrea TaxID=676965 RepID=A0A2T0AL35_9FIRM|nr:50S ribosomal protein L24 [Moorella humiferrea]MBE3571579.1 50S ribosomal protein L24 [Moorella humiferrea]PRR69320.1 50S ribosomal protein L24 [Moorella humiferrea]